MAIRHRSGTAAGITRCDAGYPYEVRKEAEYFDDIFPPHRKAFLWVSVHLPEKAGVARADKILSSAADPHGNVYFTRRRVNQAFLEALLEEFHKNGAKILERVGQEQPGTFMKVLAKTLALLAVMVWRVLRVCGVSRAPASIALSKETQPNTPPRRPGPVGVCSDAELADHIRRQIAASRLHGEGYRKLWARLRFAGVRASPRRVRRVMRENGLLAPHRVGRTETKPHDGTIITDKLNEMWGTDMTQTITVREGRANVFVTVEHANSEVVGIHASRSANRFEALEPVRQGVHRCFGAIAPGVARGLKLRHDHGSNYMSGDFQDEIECLGIEASPSFVREPEGNGVAERFIRTLKENLLWVRTFDTIEELRVALVEFATRYNETWLVARHGYRTPAQVRAEQCQLDQNATADLKLAA